MSLLDSVQRCAARNGLNLFGLVDARRYDGCQPCEQRSTALQSECGTIVVLATGGRAFWREFEREHGHLPRDVDCDEVDAMAAAGVHNVADELRRSASCEVQVVDAREPCLSVPKLAEAAGLGIVSPVSGMLLHPEFGPWLRVRGALLVPGRPFGAVPDASIAETFKPCCTCRDRPCVTACPPKVHDVETGTSDRSKCADHRNKGGCETGCQSRMICPIGVEHADGDGPVLHAHSIGMRTLQRWYGFGWWRMVPRRLRGGPRP